MSVGGSREEQPFPSRLLPCSRRDQSWQNKRVALGGLRTDSALQPEQPRQQLRPHEAPALEEPGVPVPSLSSVEKGSMPGSGKLGATPLLAHTAWPRGFSVRAHAMEKNLQLLPPGVSRRAAGCSAAFARSWATSRRNVPAASHRHLPQDRRGIRAGRQLPRALSAIPCSKQGQARRFWFPVSGRYLINSVSDELV